MLCFIVEHKHPIIANSRFLRWNKFFNAHVFNYPDFRCLTVSRIVPPPAGNLALKEIKWLLEQLLQTNLLSGMRRLQVRHQYPADGVILLRFPVSHYRHIEEQLSPLPN
jgi:hypothetical protein